MNSRASWVVAGAALLMVAGAADAARIGAGRSMGVQRPSITAPRVAPPAAQAAPAQSSQAFKGPAADPVMPRTAPTAGAASNASAAPATGATAAGARSTTAAAPATAAAARSATPAAGGARFLGPLAGIATALGIAALLSHLGFNPAMSDVLTFGLLVLATIVLARMLLARRAREGEAIPAAPPVPPPSRATGDALLDTRFGGSLARQAREDKASRWPPGFDAERFARQAIQQFRAVQRAYDHGDTALLADVMTPELYTEAVKELRARGLHVPTEFDGVDAEVIDVTTEADLYWVSVRFHGLSREDGARMAQPFDEVWNLSKPTDGSSGWLVAGIQQSIAA